MVCLVNDQIVENQCLVVADLGQRNQAVVSCEIVRIQLEGSVYHSLLQKYGELVVMVVMLEIKGLKVAHLKQMT